MKKVLLVAVAGMFVLASCKKEYTCECSTSILGETIAASTVIKDTKSNATTACEEGSSTVSGIAVKCAIK